VEAGPLSEDLMPQLDAAAHRLGPGDGGLAIGDGVRPRRATKACSTALASRTLGSTAPVIDEVPAGIEQDGLGRARRAERAAWDGLTELVRIRSEPPLTISASSPPRGFVGPRHETFVHHRDRARHRGRGIRAPTWGDDRVTHQWPHVASAGHFCPPEKQSPSRLQLREGHARQRSPAAAAVRARETFETARFSRSRTSPPLCLHDLADRSKLRVYG